MARSGGRQQLLLALALVAGLAAAGSGAHALDFEMNTQTKCVYEEINAGALVVGDYTVSHRDNAAQAVYADVRVSVGGTVERTRDRAQHLAYPCAAGQARAE